jgi:hypothetical protein
MCRTGKESIEAAEAQMISCLRRKYQVIVNRGAFGVSRDVEL